MAKAAVAYRNAATAAIGTSFAAHVTDGSWDVTVEASAGDVIEVGSICTWGGGAAYTYGDFATIVSGAPVNWVSSGTSTGNASGILGLFNSQNADHQRQCGSWFYTVQAGDIVSGQVTFRLYAKVSTGTRTLLCDATFPSIIWASRCYTAPVTTTVTGTSSGGTTTLMTGTASLAAAAGDVLEVIPAVVVNPASTSIAIMDACTVVSGTKTNYFSTGNGTQASEGISAWRCDMADYQALFGGQLYAVQAGDISGGNVTVGITIAVTGSNRSLDSGSKFALRKVS